MSKLGIVVLACLVLSATANAQPTELSDTLLSAANGHVVTALRTDGSALVGTLVAFDPNAIVIALEGTGRLVSLPRAETCELRLGASRLPPTGSAQPVMAVTAASTRPARERHVGLQLYQGPGNLMLDVQAGHFYGYIGTSIGYPIIFSGKPSGEDQYIGAVVGLAGSWKISPRSNWRFDLGGTLLPTWWGGFSMGIGLSAGFHYTSPNGFTAGFQIPVFGVAPGCNSIVGDSDYNSSCPRVKTGAELVGNYYLQAGMSLPIMSVGYRF